MKEFAEDLAASMRLFASREETTKRRALDIRDGRNAIASTPCPECSAQPGEPCFLPSDWATHQLRMAHAAAVIFRPPYVTLPEVVE